MLARPRRPHWYAALTIAVIGATLATPVSASPQAGTGRSTPNRPTLITSVNVITMEDTAVLRGVSVLVHRGKIDRIMRATDTTPVPASTLRIDGHGGWLIPGLIDSHIHYNNDSELPSYLRHGVTTVLSLGDPQGVIARFPAAQAKIAAGTLPSPTVYAAGPSIANHIKLEDTTAARAFVRNERAVGHPFVKIYNGTTREVFDAVVDEARRNDMGVFGHMPRTIEPAYVVTHGLDVLAHLEELFFTSLGGYNDAKLTQLTPDWTPDTTTIDRVLDLMKANDVALIPNLIASYSFFELWVNSDAIFAAPEMKYLEPEDLEGWRTQNYSKRSQANLRMLRERLKMPLLYRYTWRAKQAGVTLLAGTDAPVPPMLPGKSLHAELRLLVAVGLTPLEALATATRNAGDVIRKHVDHTACVGVVRVGCEADLVLLSADPTVDIRNSEAIVGIMNDGRWFTPDAVRGTSTRRPMR